MNEKIQKKKTHFLVFFACGVLLAALVAGIIYSDKSVVLRKQSSIVPAVAAEQQQLLQNCISLHASFGRLQELDQEYNDLLFNNAGQQSIRNAEAAINEAEKNMQLSIDSVKMLNATFDSWQNALLLDSICNAFSMALANRNYIAEIRGTVTGKTINADANLKKIMQLQKQITVFEQQLKTKPPQATVAFEENVPDEALQQQELKNQELVVELDKLEKENQRLDGEIARAVTLRNEDRSSVVAAKSRVQKLEDEINELNAEINFARIDCSLSRADANKIISNSRQRKELLSAALKSLQVLSESRNENIQRRAKEKISHLTEIASTIRD